MSLSPRIDLRFQVFGENLDVDHGYALFSAVSKVLPIFHSADDVAMSLIRGRYIGDGKLSIAPASSLAFRIKPELAASYINLAGKSLDVSGHKLRVGVPASHGLVPAATLHAHLVTTRNGHEQERFEKEMENQLGILGCRGKITIGKRRTFKVHGRQVVGYSVLVSELTAEESIAIQEKGLGGRRKMGCGFFQPWRG